MKELFLVMAAFVLVCALLGRVNADYSTTLTWQYDNPPADLAGFHVYNGPNMVLDIPIPSAREAALAVPLNDGDNVVTMRAYDKAGQESVSSDPVIYNPPPNGKVILQLPVVWLEVK